MATDFKRGDTGINTAEGQISGPRAARLAKQRQEDQKDYESKKQKIQVWRKCVNIPCARYHSPPPPGRSAFPIHGVTTNAIPLCGG